MQKPSYFDCSYWQVKILKLKKEEEKKQFRNANNIKCSAISRHKKLRISKAMSSIPVKHNSKRLTGGRYTFLRGFERQLQVIFQNLARLRSHTETCRD